MFRVLSVFLVVLSGINFYIAHRLSAGLKQLLPWLGTGVLFAILTGLTVLTMLGFARSMLPLGDGFKKFLGIFFAWWLGLFMYLAIYTVVSEPLWLAAKLARLASPERLARIRSLGILVLTAATVLWGGIHARQIRHITYEVPLDACTREVQEMNIVLISDVHLGAIGSEGRMEAIVQRINALEPDLVCIAGDFFDSDFLSISDPDRARETLLKLKATHGIYACLGNHDAGATYPQMAEFLESCSIRCLKEEYVVVADQLILAGRLDASPIGGFGGLTRQKDFRIINEEDLPVIILDHNPARADQYGDEIDLVLSGHTHKGQIFPGSLITGRMYTVDHGHYRPESGPQVVVTSGVGYWGMPLRIGTDCEIVTIRLVSGN